MTQREQRERVAELFATHGRTEPLPANDWRAMPPAAFDPSVKPQPLALFPAPDPTGTPDLFDTEES